MVELAPDEVWVMAAARPGYAVAEEGGYLAALDIGNDIYSGHGAMQHGGTTMSSVSVPDKVREVGKIVTPLTIVNHRDQGRAAAGDIPPDQVRAVTLDAVIVDTGATTLALPADVIARLGLTVRREVPILTATGPSTARLCQDAAVTLLGREGTFDCLELPAGMDALLGVIPMEALGLEPDLRNQRLRLLPEEPGDTYYTIY